MQPKIDIIVPVLFSKRGHLTTLVSSIGLQNLNGIDSVAITFVVNPARPPDVIELSNQLTTILKEKPKFKIQMMTIKNSGVNSARQLGLDSTSGSLVFFFDDDVQIADPNLIQIHFANHSTNPDIFAVGGYYSLPKNARLFSEMYLNRQIQWLNESYTDFSKSRSNYLIGGHFSIKRSLLQKHQIEFDTNIKFGSSETDFFLSARQKGLELVLIKNSVTHDIEDSPLSLILKVYNQGSGKRYIESKGLAFSPKFRSIVQPHSRSARLIHSLFQVSFSWGYFAFDRNYAGFFKFYGNQFTLFLKYQKQKWINYLRNDF